MSQEKNQQDSSAGEQQSDNLAHAVSGAGGGLIAMALTYPLITLSTRAQVESQKEDSSLLQAVKKIIDREGVSGLFSGLDSALMGITLTNFVYYYWYEFSRSAFERAAVKAGRASSRLTTWELMAAGALAGSATVFLTNPIWVVNTRMTARQEEQEEESKSPKEKPTTLGTLMKMLKEEGPTSLFAGVMPALVLVANPILQYTIFEELKSQLEKRRKVGPTDSFYLGALGKLAATSITYPYLTVKSRAHVAGKDGPKESMTQTLRNIINNEGWSALYGGIGPKVTQSMLTAAFLFAFKDLLYEYTIKARKAVKN